MDKKNMDTLQITPEDNSNRMDVLEAKMNILLLFAGGQFFIALAAFVITVIK